MSVSETVRPSGRYDPAERRLAQRVGRQKGCRVYIPAEELLKAGYGPDEDPPAYRVWGAPRGRIVIQLYRSQA